MRRSDAGTWACLGLALAVALVPSCELGPRVHPEGVLPAVSYQLLREAERRDEPGPGGVPKPRQVLLTWGDWELTAGLSVRRRRGVGALSDSGPASRDSARFRVRRRDGGVYFEVTLRW